MQRFVAFFATVPVLWATAASGAQNALPATRPATRPAGGGIDWPAFLIYDPGVQAELDLSPSQRKAVMPITDELEGPLWALRNYAPEEQARRSQLLAAKLQERLKRVLTETQLRRLAQITFQARGVAAALRPEAASTLAFTDDQLRRIEALIEKTRLSMEGLDTLARRGRNKDVLDQARTIVGTKERDEFRAILTNRQKQQWAALSGKTFDVSLIRPILFRAPELRGEQTWINSKPLSLAGLHGQVAIVHFWTFGCSNCRANYAAYRLWQKTYARKGVTIIGIHTPETEGERSIDTLRAKVKENDLQFPILVDNERKNWTAWSNNIWPAVYLVDKQGRIRYWWYGELNWKGATGDKYIVSKIEELLAE